MKIGIISDTHGLVRLEALAALAESELIIHAGDVGSPEVLAALEAIAPVVAVRGNCDHGIWAEILPDTRIVSAGSASILVIHDVKAVGALPSGITAVVAGHSHQPSLISRDGVMYLNPGSAGPRRFKLPVTVARMQVEGGRITAEIFDIGHHTS